MADSQNLLAQYARHGSESAFQELVSRYLGLVYSTALRLVGGDTHLAEDVAQTVFIALARKARTLAREPLWLGGWLHRHTCYVASTTMRTARRRQARERQVMEMNALEDHTTANLARIAPVLDEAINRLEARDRQAILLRFFEQRDLRSVGQALGTTEDAAQKRVSRALEKLQGLLKQEGVVLSVAALGTGLTVGAVKAAPVGLAARISATALSSALGSSGLILNLLILMARAKLKGALAVGAVLLVSVGISVYHGGRPSAAPMPEAPGEASMGNETDPAGAVLSAVSQPQRKTPPEPPPALQDALANLWRALREKPVDEQGHVTSQKVFNALRLFGPDAKAAIPILLDGLVETNSSVGTCSYWGFQFLGHQADETIPSLVGLFRSESLPRDVRICALQALHCMGAAYETRPADVSAIAVAVPDLIYLLRDRDIKIRERAADTLRFIGSYAQEAVPILTESLSFSSSREEAIAELNQRWAGKAAVDEVSIQRERDQLTGWYRISAAEALSAIASDAQAAVPWLTELFTNSDPRVRFVAGVDLWRLAGCTNGINVIAAGIYPPGDRDRPWNQALDALGEMGPAAQAAVPNLLRLCDFADVKNVREPALKALWKIDPETAAQVPPVPQVPAPAASSSP